MKNSYYETQYNTRTGVHNVDGIFAQWRTDSEQVRGELTCYIDRPYGTTPRETIDLFIAPNRTRWIVFIHGGYWQVMTAGAFSFVAQPFVQAGWNVALIEYDLCPTVTIQTITDQCRRGIAWLHHHAPTYSAGCEQMVITGHSAGGHLTGMMFATDWAHYNMPTDVITGGIAISGLFDLAPLMYTAMNDNLQLTPSSVPSISPFHLRPQIKAPLVLSVGERESLEFHRQSQSLAGDPAWQPLTHDPVIITDRHHFDILDDFLDLGGQMWQALESLKR